MKAWAIASYDVALAIKLDKEEALYNQAIGLHHLNQVGPAVEALRQAIKLLPENRELARSSSAFDAIKEDPRFRELVVAN